MSRTKQTRLVFSAGVGRIDEERGPRSRPPRHGDASGARGDGVVRVRRETGGRGGKTVTTIAGVPLASPDLRALACDLKRACGAGGSVTDGAIEIQGDHRDAVVAALRDRGYTVKLAGG